MFDKFEIVPVAEIKPDERNTRKHSDEQIMELRRSLREFGFVNPLLIDKDKKIIAGHGRLIAAVAEGMDAVPCIFVEHLTEAQRRAYEQVSGISWPGEFHRHDIGWRAIARS